MKTGRVVGSVVCSVKDPGLLGTKLLLLQKIERSGNGEVIVAVDAIRVCGRGDLVYYISSKEAAMALRRDMSPVDAAIMGFVERYDVQQ